MTIKCVKFYIDFADDLNEQTLTWEIVNRASGSDQPNIYTPIDFVLVLPPSSCKCKEVSVRLDY